MLGDPKLQEVTNRSYDLLCHQSWQSTNGHGHTGCNCMSGHATGHTMSPLAVQPVATGHDQSSFIYKKVLNQASGSVSFLSSSWTCATSQSRDTPSTGTFSSLSLLWYLHQRSAAAVTAPSCCCCCKCRWSSMSSSLQGGTNATMMCSLPEPTHFYYTCDWSCNQSWQSVIGSASSHGNLRLVVQPIVAICNWLYNQL